MTIRRLEVDLLALREERRRAIEFFVADWLHRVASLGPAPVARQLDLELMQRIRNAIDCNMSLHGGSDTPGHYFKEAAKIGVSKVNNNSDLRYAYRTTLERVLKENSDEFAIVKLMPPVYEAVQKVVEEKIDTFGSADKAIF